VRILYAVIARRPQADAAIHLRVVAARWIASSLRFSQL
jgi:hypothetical protein